MSKAEQGDIWADYERRRDALSFYDCSIWLGEAAGFPLAAPFSFQGMRDYMGSHHVAGGLVSHWAGLTLSPQRGNRELLEITAGVVDNWRMVFTGLPLYPSDEAPLPGQTPPHPRLGGVRLFPRSHSYALTEWVVGTLLRWLELHNLPLFLWHTEAAWQDIYTLALSHPKLTVVVETQCEKILYHMRTLLPLMRDCGNVYVDTSNLTGQGYLEQIVRDCGADRVLFGTFFPVNDVTVSMGMLLDAELAQEQRRLIASGNLLRLWKAVSLKGGVC